MSFLLDTDICSASLKDDAVVMQQGDVSIEVPSTLDSTRTVRTSESSIRSKKHGFWVDTASESVILDDQDTVANKDEYHLSSI